jgi:hypothetical protein
MIKVFFVQGKTQEKSFRSLKKIKIMSTSAVPSNDITNQRKEADNVVQREEEEENSYLLEFTEPQPPDNLKTLDKKMDECTR